MKYTLLSLYYYYDLSETVVLFHSYMDLAVVCILFILESSTLEIYTLGGRHCMHCVWEYNCSGKHWLTLFKKTNWKAPFYRLFDRWDPLLRPKLSAKSESFLPHPPLVLPSTFVNTSPSIIPPPIPFPHTIFHRGTPPPSH